MFRKAGNLKEILLFFLLFIHGFFIYSLYTDAINPYSEEMQIVYINPIYRDTLFDNELLEMLEKNSDCLVNGKSSGQDLITREGFELYESAFMSLDDAAEYMRSQMVNRESVIELYIDTPELNPEKTVDDIFHTALKHTGIPCEGDYLKYNYGGFTASVAYAVIGEMYRLRISYNMLYYTNREQEQEVDRLTQSILSELDIYRKNDFEKISSIFDYIAQNVEYDYANLNNDSYKLKFTAYAALTSKTAVCQGYSMLLYRLLLESGVDSRVISGLGSGEAHGWNIIRLDGYYYNADTTWESSYLRSGKRHYWFMKCDENFSGHVRDVEYQTSDFVEKYPMSTTDLDEDKYLTNIEYALGDINEDGTVNRADKIYLARYLANWPGYIICNVTVADLTGDGLVNRADKIFLARYLAGWPEYRLD